MTLESIMTRHVVTVGMDDSLETVQSLFDRYKFHHVVVLDECRVVGVLSDRDLLKNISPFVGKPTERAIDAASIRKRVHQVMTRHVVTAKPDMPAGDATLMMLNSRVSCLPVLDDHGACVGIVTARDMLRWALAHLSDNACPAKLRTEAKKKAA